MADSIQKAYKTLSSTERSLINVTGRGVDSIIQEENKIIAKCRADYEISSQRKEDGISLCESTFLRVAFFNMGFREKLYAYVEGLEPQKDKASEALKAFYVLYFSSSSSTTLEYRKKLIQEKEVARPQTTSITTSSNRFLNSATSSPVTSSNRFLRPTTTSSSNRFLS